MCRHLATLCRMYNDWGSAVRDNEEGNLNSLDFPEFAADAATVTAPPDEDKNKLQQIANGDHKQPDPAIYKQAPREELFALAQYERAGMEEAARRLALLAGGDQLRARALGLLDLFCSVTDTYGQIYVARDIGSRMMMMAVQ